MGARPRAFTPKYPQWIAAVPTVLIYEFFTTYKLLVTSTVVEVADVAGISNAYPLLGNW